MAVSSKSKYFTLACLFALLLLCFLATTWFLVTRSYREVGYYQQALQAYQTGKTAHAKELMQNVIRDDWNNELAIVTLADWFDRDREWNFSAWLWLRAASLNTFKPEYLQKARQAFFQCRAFQEAFNSFEQKKIPLSDKETLQYAYAALSIGEGKRAQELFDTVKAEELLQTPLARLLAIYLPHDKEKPKEQTAKELTGLLDCGDDYILFECLIDLHFLELTHFKQPEKAIEHLRQAATLDPLCGMPILGDFYFTAQQYDKAAETYQKNPENGFWDIALICRFGEALTLTRQPEELEILVKKCQTGDKDLLVCGFYLDALQALLENDLEKLVFSFEKTAGRFESPMAMLLNLLVQIQKKNHFEIESLTRFFASDASLADFRGRADQALFPHLTNLLQDGQLANAAALARIMLKDRKPDLLLTRIDISDKAQQGILDLADMNQALRWFPEDEFLLNQSVELNLASGNFSKAQQDVETLQKKSPDDPGLSMLSIMALTGLKNFSKADAAFADLLQKSPDDLNALNNFLNYCSSHKRIEGLQQQIARLEQTVRPEIREYLSVMQALNAFLKQTFPEAEKQLSALRTDNPELQYHAAFMLGAMDRIQPAILFYRKIPKDHPKYSISRLNLSELLSIAGDKAEALSIARNTWESAPDWSAARECYGLRLLEIGRSESAAEILDTLMVNRNATPRAREGWRNAMHQTLEKQFEAKEFDSAQKTVRRILLYWQNDTLAASFASRIRDALLEQEKATREAAEQKP